MEREDSIISLLSSPGIVLDTCNTAIISKGRCFCVYMYDWFCSRLHHIQGSYQRPSLWARDTQLTTILIVKNIPLFKTTASQRSFQYKVVSLWNGLDKDEGKKRRIKEERGGRAWLCFFHLIFFIFIFAIMTSKYKNTETTH